MAIRDIRIPQPVIIDCQMKIIRQSDITGLRDVGLQFGVDPGTAIIQCGRVCRRRRKASGEKHQKDARGQNGRQLQQ